MNAIALLTLFACAIDGVWLLRRALRRTSARENPACARCRQPAASLESFVCPTCGHDVRELGLVPPPGRSPAGHFWRFVAFTAVLVVIASPISGMLAAAVPSHQRFAYTAALRTRIDNREITLLCLGTTVHEGPAIRQTLEATSESSDGSASTFAVHFPSKRCWTESSPESGRNELGEYSRQKLATWMGNDATVDVLAREFDYFAGGGSVFGRRVGMNPPGLAWSGGGSVFLPDWFVPSAVIAWSATWLAVVGLILRARKS